MGARANHPVRDDIDLLEGDWYATEPHETWRWMREHAPVYFDEKSDTWALTRYEDVLTVEKDPATSSSKRAPRPHGDPLPMMISMDNPQHQRRRSLVSRGFTPRRVGFKTPSPQSREYNHQFGVSRRCLSIAPPHTATSALAQGTLMRHPISSELQRRPEGTQC